MLTISFHPLLSCRVFSTKFPAMLGALVPSRALVAACTPDGPAPVHGSETVRAAVRDLLRHSGFKPTGRSKPSSEYLAKAVADGGFPAINVAVDAGNAVSLHSGLPVSVIDLARSRPPFHVAPAARGTNYVFNRSGQVIDVGNLLCLHDADGACANPVKDAQRTKTDADSIETLSIIWGAAALGGHVDATLRWYLDLLGTMDGVECAVVETG